MTRPVDLLTALHGRRCTACKEGLLRVLERGGLTLLVCPNGCPARAVLGAAGLPLDLLVREAVA